MNLASRWKRLPPPLRIAAGIGMLFLGVLGLFLPGLQGVLFIMIGLMMLSEDIPWVRRLLDRLKTSPALGRLRQKWERMRTGRS